MFKKMMIFIFLLLLSLSGCSKWTNTTPSGVSIEGKVLVNDKLSNEEFLIQVYKENNDEAIADSSIDQNGKFEVTIQEDGNYMLKAVNPNGNDYRSNKVTFSIKDNKLESKVDFTLIISDERAEATSSISVNDPVAIEGTVTYPKEVNYVDIKVLLSNKEGGKPQRVFMVDKVGEFKITGIQDGIYYLSAEGPNNLVSKSYKVEVINEKVIAEEKIVIEIPQTNVSN